MEIVLAEPRGFCAGVERAIAIVEEAIRLYGAPVYVRHEIVHNKYVVEDLKAKGAVFVKEVDEVPDGAVTIFSAHGVSDAVEDAAASRQLPVIDATCPLVTKVHNQARRNEHDGRQIILIGHAGHPEVEGTSGKVKGGVKLVESVEDVETLEVDDPERLAYVTQTTLSVNDTKDIIAALRKRFPFIIGPDTDDICYATQNRQDAVSALAKEADLVLVVGAANSSNSNRLRDLAVEEGVEAYLINDQNELQEHWLEGKTRIGITAGASAPDILVEQLIDRLKELTGGRVRILDGIKETVSFKLPKAAREKILNVA